jgi:hypothetical protein
VLAPISPDAAERPTSRSLLGCDKPERGENVTLVTADKLAKGLDLTLAGLLSELERCPGDSG